MIHVGLVEAWDKIVKNIVWSDQDMGTRPRVDYATLLLSLEEGGLALISIKTHTIAMAAKTMLWMVAAGDHTLQLILKAKIANLSERR